MRKLHNKMKRDSQMLAFKMLNLFESKKAFLGQAASILFNFRAPARVIGPPLVGVGFKVAKAGQACPIVTMLCLLERK